MIQCTHVYKRYKNGTNALYDINLSVDQGEFVYVIGPTGSGKSTLIKLMDAEEMCTKGNVKVVGIDVGELSKRQIPIYRRNIGVVFQDYKLLPHLTVFENIAYALEVIGMKKAQIRKRTIEVMKVVGLSEKGNSFPKELSGGQQQRVAIARALVNEPKVLLLDESLSALDKNLRKEMQLELKEIQREVGITFIFVTHDQEEALTMSDKIVILKDGDIEQVGSPTEVYNEPINQYCARFIGDSNIIDGVMKKDNLVNFDDVDYNCVDYGFSENEPVDIVIRPEDIDIVARNRGLLNGEVKSVLFKGVHYEVIVETSSGTSKTVTMHVTGEHDVVNAEAKEHISASSFTMDLEDVDQLTDSEVIARANAQAWTDEGEDVSLTHVEYDVKKEIGTYSCTFSTAAGTKITVKINVVEPAAVEDIANEEGIQAFDFYRTVDDIKESVALDTDLIRWADAYAWNIEDDSRVEIWDVKYDFDDENITEGDYQITFSTQGRELKIETTDKIEAGERIGLQWNPEDIHVMRKMG